MANQLWANSQATLILWMRPRNMNKEKLKQYFDTTLLMDPKCNNNVVEDFKEEQASSPWMECLKLVLEKVMSYNVVLTKVKRKNTVKTNMLFGMKRHFC